MRSIVTLVMTSSAHAPRTLRARQEGKVLPLAVAHTPAQRFLLENGAAETAVPGVGEDVARAGTYPEAARLAAGAPLGPLLHPAVLGL